MTNYGFVVVVFLLWHSQNVSSANQQLEYFAQARVTDSDIVRLNEATALGTSGSNLPVVSPTALQISSWSFTLADSVLIAYASTEDRDVALQQITQIWEDALAPQVTDVQVVLVDDRPDMSNPTNFDGAMASIVTYAVLGNTPTPVDTWTAKTNFRTLITATRIPVIPVNITHSAESFAWLESLGLDYHTLGERDVLLQQIKVIWQQLLASEATHVQMTLYNDAPALGGTADHHYITYLITGDSSSKLNAAALEQEFRQKLLDSHLVGNGIWGISITDPSLMGLANDSTTPEATTTERVKTPTTVYVSPQEPFEIMDSVLLPYVNAAQVGQLLQQIKEYWIVVLGPRFVTRDIRFINSTLENVTVSGKVVLVYDIAYEISGLTDLKVDVEHVRREFHRAVLELLTPDESASVIILKNVEVTEGPSSTASTEAPTTPPATTSTSETSTTTMTTTTTTTPTPMTTLIKTTTEAPTASTTTTTSTTETPAATSTRTTSESLPAALPSTSMSSSAVPSTKAVTTADLTTTATITFSSNTGTTTLPGASEFSTFDLSANAAKNLLHHTLAGVNVHEVHSSVFYENIVFQTTNRTNLELVMEAMRHLWMEAFENKTTDVQLAVYRNVSSTGAAGEQLENVDYVVLVLNKDGLLDTVSAKDRFRYLLAHAGTEQGFLTNGDLWSKITSRQLNNNVILDSVAIMSTGLVDVDALMEVIRKIWANLLGNDAEGVQVSIYRDAPRGAVGPVAGNADIHEFFYIVLVQTKRNDLDIDRLRATAAHTLQGIPIEGITVIPEPEHSTPSVLVAAENVNRDIDALMNETKVIGPLLGFAVRDTIWLNYTTDGDRVLALEAVLDLWKNVLGPNAMDVRVIVSNITSTNQSASAHEVAYTVYVVTKSTTYDQEEVKKKFHDAVDAAASVLSDREVPPPTTAATSTGTTTVPKSVISGNLRTATPESIESYLVYDTVLVNYTTEPEREAAVNLLTQMWIHFLGSDALNVQVRPYSDVKDDTTGLHRINYSVLLLSHNSIWDLEKARKEFHDTTLPSSNTTVIPPMSVVDNVGRPDLMNLIVIPAGLSISYSTKQELANMLQVIHSLWQKLLGSNATSIEITLYKDTVSPDLQTSDGKSIHDISYVVVIQTPQTNLSKDELKSKFEQLLPSSESLLSDSILSQEIPAKTTEVVASKVEIPVAFVGPSVSQAPLPYGLVIPDHIWLVYRNETERRNYLDIMKVIWQKVLAGLKTTNVSLNFDHENADNSSSDKADSHEVFYFVTGETTNTDVNINHAKTLFRKALPTGNFMFGFDPEEDAQLAGEDTIVSTASTNDVRNFTADGWAQVKPSDIPFLKATLDDLPKTVITDTALLQYVDDDERDAELDAVRKTWSDIFVLPIEKVQVQIIKDTIKSTDSSFRPGSIHDIVYAVTSPVNMSDENYLERWLSYEHSLAKLPFVVNVSQLVAPVTMATVFGVPVDSLIHNATLLNLLLQKVSQDASWHTEPNISKVNDNLWNVIQNESEPVDVRNSSVSSVNGTFILRYSNDTEKDAKLQNILNLWNSQFGFNQSVVNLTISSLSTTIQNDSSNAVNGLLHTKTYTLWSPLTVNLAVIQSKFEDILSLNNVTVAHSEPVPAENLLQRTGDLFAVSKGNMNATNTSTSTSTSSSTSTSTTTQPESTRPSSTVRRFLNS